MHLFKIRLVIMCGALSNHCGGHFGCDIDALRNMRKRRLVKKININHLDYGVWYKHAHRLKHG